VALHSLCPNFEIERGINESRESQWEQLHASALPRCWQDGRIFGSVVVICGAWSGAATFRGRPGVSRRWLRMHMDDLPEGCVYRIARTIIQFDRRLIEEWLESRRA
jgi:hypothetical protein